MHGTTRWLSFLSRSVLLAAMVGCSAKGPISGNDGGVPGAGSHVQGGGGTGGTGGAQTDAGGTGGSSGAAGTHADGGSTGGSGGGAGTHADGGSTGGSGGAAGTHTDGGSNGGAGGAHGDAADSEDGRGDAAGTCPGSANAMACVACCDVLYPGGFQDAFFGNECLYCTSTCGDTRICRGVTATKEIDGPCLRCTQHYLGQNCEVGSPTRPRCQGFVECLKQCPTN